MTELIVKRYRNRKLRLNIESIRLLLESSNFELQRIGRMHPYINLKEVSSLVKHGFEVKVLNQPTGEDYTARALIQAKHREELASLDKAASV